MTVATAYKVLRDPNDEDKLAPQEAVIFTAIESQKNPTRKETIEKLKLAVDNGTLKTRQPVERLLSYYQRDLVEKGIIEVVKTGGEEDEAPAKAKGKGRKAA